MFWRPALLGHVSVDGETRAQPGPAWAPAKTAHPHNISMDVLEVMRCWKRLSYLSALRKPGGREVLNHLFAAQSPSSCSGLHLLVLPDGS